MNKLAYFAILKKILYFGSVFMVAEAVVHFSGFRLLSVENWPAEAISFTFFFQQLWGSVSLLLAYWLFQVARSQEEQKKWVWPMAVFAVFHGVVLLYWGFVLSQQMWVSPSLFVFNPWYSLQVILEAVTLFSFTAFAFFGKCRKWL